MLLQITQAIDTAAALPEAALQAVQTQEKIPVMELAVKGGWIMIPIVLLLFVSIYVFVERWIVINKASRDESALMASVRDYVMDDRLDSAKTLCRNTCTPTARIIEKGIDRIGKPVENIKSAMEDAGNIEVARLERNISWVSTTAGAAPMIGFLGTVTGMVRVFFDMASKGNNIEVGTLADGMYQAMVTTVAGLIVGLSHMCATISSFRASAAPRTCSKAVRPSSWICSTNRCGSPGKGFPFGKQEKEALWP